MKSNEYFDRREAESLLPDRHDEHVIAAENLTLSTTPYERIKEQSLDEADAKRVSAIERTAAKKRELEQRRQLAKFGLPDTKPARKHSPKSEYAAEAYKLNRRSKGVTGPGSVDTPTPVSRLMKELNINLDLQFSRRDTYDLMAVLLTCNEAQLEAMLQNRSMPVMVKTIAKAIMEDYKNCNTWTVEKLWNRLFGPTLTEQSAQPQVQPGHTTINVLSVVPGISSGTRPISREGYALIRDKIFGADAEAEEVND